MSTPTLRKKLADAITPLLPARKYRIKTGLGVVDRLAKPLIQFEQTTLEPAPTAQGLALVELRLHVVTHLVGITEAAEDAIDHMVLEVFEACVDIPWINPLRAEKGVYKEQHLSYIITVQILTKRS